MQPPPHSSARGVTSGIGCGSNFEQLLSQAVHNQLGQLPSGSDATGPSENPSPGPRQDEAGVVCYMLRSTCVRFDRVGTSELAVSSLVV